MRLSDVLSNPHAVEFQEIDRFMNSKLQVGKQRKIEVGKIALNYFCGKCNDSRTFLSDSKLYCIGISLRQISIDCVLSCAGECDSSVTIWFVVECQDGEDTDIYRKYINNYIYGIAPKVRVLKYREKLSEHVRLNERKYVDYAEMLDKAEQAYRDGLGAGAVVYLRKIYEKVTISSANAIELSYKKRENGNPTNFYSLLKEVDEKCKIVPDMFSADGYRLFSELSVVIHGDYDEDLGLKKYKDFHRLVIGILDNVNNNNELLEAKSRLGWSVDTGGDADD